MPNFKKHYILKLISIIIAGIFIIDTAGYGYVLSSRSSLRIPIGNNRRTIEVMNLYKENKDTEKLWSDDANGYIKKFNLDNLSLDKPIFFIGVKHVELSEDEKREILQALKLQGVKKVGVELFAGEQQYLKPGSYWVDLMDFLKNEGFDVILLKRDSEIELQAQIIQYLRRVCAAVLEHIGEPRSELVKNMQIYKKELEGRYRLFRNIFKGLPEDTFHKHELMGREYFSKILALSPGSQENFDLFYELEEKSVELSIKTSFEMLKVSQDENVGAAITGAAHASHWLALTEDNTWPGIILNADIRGSTQSIDIIVSRGKLHILSRKITSTSL